MVPVSIVVTTATEVMPAASLLVLTLAPTLVLLVLAILTPRRSNSPSLSLCVHKLI